MRSFFEYIDVPGEIQVLLFSLSAVLIIGFFASGIDLGFLKIPKIPDARKKTALMAGIVLFALSVLARQPFFHPPKEAVVDPVAYTASSSCSGDWIYQSRETCDDVSKPVYKIVTDGELCGFAEVSKTIQPEGFKSCRDISHGVERYANSEVVHQNSGRVGGGHSQPWWCQTMKNRYQAARPNLQVVWTDQTSGESSDKDWKGHVTYNYWCRAVAHWNPIYAQVASPACERLDPEVVIEQVAQTCEDTSNPVSYRQTQNASCAFSEKWDTSPHASNAQLAERYSANLANQPICATCSSLSANAEQQANCLIRNFGQTQKIEFSNSSAEEKIVDQIRKTVRSLLSSGRYLETSTQQRLQSIAE